jgi:hypothetical protein
MKHLKYNKEDLILAIKNSISIRAALLTLNIAAKGGNYRVIHKAIKEYNIDISHFKQQAWAKGKNFGPKRDLKEYLSNQFSITSYKLKTRILRENVFPYQCSNCLLDTWLDQKIPLELDHINGNHMDNSLCNLRLLCPNCHALTHNYRGKNIRKSTKLGSV